MPTQRRTLLRPCRSRLLAQAARSSDAGRLHTTLWTFLCCVLQLAAKAERLKRAGLRAEVRVECDRPHLVLRLLPLPLLLLLLL